jgi:peptide/nickel transport system substrate-binding protein
MIKKYLAFGLVLCLLLSIFAGCGPKEEVNETPDGTEVDTPVEGTEEGGGGTFNVGIVASPGGVFNPALATDSYDFYITDLVFQGLLQLNPDYDFEGVLAESWEVNEDGTVFTFRLREGVLWHDGESFTAEDVKFSLEYLADPNYPGSRASYVSSIKGVEAYKNGEADTVEGIEIVDGNTVVITTEEPYSSGLLRFGTNIQIFPKHIWEDQDISKALEATELLRNPIGTGPFKMEEFVPDQYIELLLFKEYWNGMPKLDKMIFQIVNAETGQAQMLSGELDYFYLSSLNKDDTDLYESMDINVYGVTYNAYQYMTMNLTMDLFKDKTVRHAFAYAVNRQAVVDDLLEGNGSVSNNPYPPEFWAFPDNLKTYDYNMEKAIELFNEAEGWEFNEADKVMTYNGEPVSLELKYSKGNKVREQSAALFQQNLKDIGIEVDLQIMEFSTLFDQVKKGDYELAFVGQGNEMDGDIKKFYHSTLIEPLGSNSGSNFIRYENPEVDRLIDLGLTTIVQEERVEIYNELALLLNEELPVVYIYHWPSGRAVTNKLEGFVEAPYKANYYYDIENWYLED